MGMAMQQKKKVLYRIIRIAERKYEKKKLSISVDNSAILRYLAMITPMILEMASIYGFCVFPVISWHSVILSIFVAVVLVAGLPFFTPAGGKTSPFTYGHVCGGVFVHLALYYVHVYPFVDDFVFLNYFFCDIFNTILVPIDSKSFCKIWVLSGS